MGTIFSSRPARFDLKMFDKIALDLLIVSGIAFGLAMLIAYMQELFSSIKESKLLKKLTELLLILFIASGVFAVLSTIVSALNQPSAFEQCMSGTDSQADPEALAWMEEYCSQNQE